MTTQNTYASLADFKSFIVSRGQTMPAGAADDTVIEKLLKAASRYIDSKTGRQFYPTYETRYYDVPDATSIDPRLLKFDCTFLAIASVTNGDTNSIASTEYDTRPRNTGPIVGIRLKDGSTTSWMSNTTGGTHAVIAVAGWVGYHDRYTNDGYYAATTLGEDLDTSETDWLVADNANLAVGQLVKVEDELGYVSAVTTDTAGDHITVAARGPNGTTAATHASGTAVYIWMPMDEAVNATCEIANAAYQRRFGRNTGGTETITAAGVVISPRDVPALATDFIHTYRNYT